MIETVPQSFLYSCDRCSQKHHQENAAGHYANSLPPTWGNFKFMIAKSETEISKGQVAEDVLLCDRCAETLEIQFHMFLQGKV